MMSADELLAFSACASEDCSAEFLAFIAALSRTS
jgi:hypothetical protein